MPRHRDFHRLVRDLDPTVILRVAELCDGHSLLDPQAFLDAGLPEPMVRHLTQTHHSDGSPKGTIFRDGQAVESVTGVYGLQMLEFLAGALGVQYPTSFGRGLQARLIRQALHQHFDATAPRS